MISGFSRLLNRAPNRPHSYSAQNPDSVGNLTKADFASLRDSRPVADDKRLAGADTAYPLLDHNAGEHHDRYQEQHPKRSGR